MKKRSLMQELSAVSYPGRGIVIGRSEDGRCAAAAYFIMGRSENSKNRIFVPDGEGLRTEAFDPSKVKDPSLIIYSPVRVVGRDTIVTNGDQTDTIYEELSAGGSFESALLKRTFEPDAPNFTPRISGLIRLSDGGFSYKLSLLKSIDGDPSGCLRYTFSYENPAPGEGRYLHTYLGDGDPLPSFEGEPTRVDLCGGIEVLTKSIWESLDKDNKISLFVRFIDLASGKHESRIVNKYQ